MFVNMNTCQPTTIILLSRYKDTNESTFTSSFSTKHCNLDSLFHIFKNIPWNWNFSEISVYTHSDFFNDNFCILISCHIKKNRQSLLHLRCWDALDNPIVLNSNPIQSMPESLIKSKDHLSSQMINPIEGGVIQLKFIFRITIVRLTFDFSKLIIMNTFFFQDQIFTKK